MQHFQTGNNQVEKYRAIFIKPKTTFLARKFP